MSFPSQTFKTPPLGGSKKFDIRVVEVYTLGHEGHDDSHAS